MTETRTLEAYLNEENIGADLILAAAQYVASQWSQFKSVDELQQELTNSTGQQTVLLNELAELAASPELLERAALMVLSLAWQNAEDRAFVIDAFEEAKSELSLKSVTVLASVLVFGLWVYMSNGGETYYNSFIIHDPNGAYRTVTTIEREPFPIDPIAIIREFRSPHEVAQPPLGDPLPHLTSDQIRKAQTALINAGYKLRVDGIEGPHTDAAVERYQRDHHLTPTGKLDRATLQQLGVRI